MLATIERYYDAVPRSSARVEEIGPFTLFVQSGAGWPFYARPRLGGDGPFAGGDVAAVRRRQQALGIPQSFEWVHETTPALRQAATSAGLTVHEQPLMLLTGALPAVSLPPDVTVRLVTEEDNLAVVSAVAAVGFAAPGTATGAEGVAARDQAAASRTPAQQQAQRDRLRAGLTVTAAAFTAAGPVATGSHQPVGAVAEIVGVATLPAFRRRGLAAAVTSLLAADAQRRGAATVFLSAGDADVARVYERLGFQRIATACIAEP